MQKTAKIFETWGALRDPDQLLSTVVPGIALFGLGAAMVLFLIGSIGTPATDSWRFILRRRRSDLAVAWLVSLVILVLCLCKREETWGFLFALLPPLLLTHHAVMIGIYARRLIGSDKDAARASTDTASIRVQKTMESYFGYRTLLLRYGLPVIVMAIANVIVFRSLTDGRGIAGFPTGSHAFVAAKYGAIGAYSYVLLELSRRTFRRDITSAFALWCTVSILLGPTLACTIELIWNGAGSSATSWQTATVYFFAGFAPRRVIASIEQAARQLLSQEHQPVVAGSRLIPLSQLRGVSAVNEERLMEEGVYDVHGLAQAEPIRLLRNTSFDFRQILAWVDEALLITNFPQAWEALEKSGIFGAADLAKHVSPADKSEQLEPLQTEAEGAPAQASPVPKDLLDVLSDEIKMERALFRTAVGRLAQDIQVKHVQALYRHTLHSDSETGAP